MITTKTDSSYTKKNTTHIYDIEQNIKLSTGEKLVINVQRTYDEFTRTLEEKFVKERSNLGIRKTLYGKSKDYEKWKVRMCNYGDDSSTAIVTEYEEDYKRFEDYFRDCPIFKDSIETSYNVNSLNKHCKDKIREIFKPDGLDEFFNFNEEELIISGDVGQYLGSCFESEFFQ